VALVGLGKLGQLGQGGALGGQQLARQAVPCRVSRTKMARASRGLAAVRGRQLSDADDQWPGDTAHQDETLNLKQRSTYVTNATPGRGARLARVRVASASLPVSRSP
jgi:hypothetical protein